MSTKPIFSQNIHWDSGRIGTVRYVCNFQPNMNKGYQGLSLIHSLKVKPTLHLLTHHPNDEERGWYKRISMKVSEKADVFSPSLDICFMVDV